MLGKSDVDNKRRKLNSRFKQAFMQSNFWTNSTNLY